MRCMALMTNINILIIRQLFFSSKIYNAYNANGSVSVSVQWTYSYGCKIARWGKWMQNCTNYDIIVEWTEWSISINQSDNKDLSRCHIINIIATSGTKIEQVWFPLYCTIRSYRAFSCSALSCDLVLGNPIVQFKLFACPQKHAPYTWIVYFNVNPA